MALQTTSKPKSGGVPTPPPTPSSKTQHVLAFPDYELVSEEHACSVIQYMPQFRPGEGVLGNKRRQRLMSLLVGLKKDHATTADGRFVQDYPDVFRYLIDNCRIGEDDENPSQKK